MMFAVTGEEVDAVARHTLTIGQALPGLLIFACVAAYSWVLWRFIIKPAVMLGVSCMQDKTPENPVPPVSKP